MDPLYELKFFDLTDDKEVPLNEPVRSVSLLFNEVFYLKNDDHYKELCEKLKEGDRLSVDEFHQMSRDAQEFYLSLLPANPLETAVSVNEVYQSISSSQTLTLTPTLSDVFTSFKQVIQYGVRSKFYQELMNKLHEGKRLKDNEFFSMSKDHQELYLNYLPSYLNPILDRSSQRVVPGNIQVLFNEVFYFKKEFFLQHLLLKLSSGERLDEQSMPLQAIRFYEGLLKKVEKEEIERKINITRLKGNSISIFNLFNKFFNSPQEGIYYTELCQNLDKGKRLTQEEFNQLDQKAQEFYLNLLPSNPLETYSDPITPVHQSLKSIFYFTTEAFYTKDPRFEKELVRRINEGERLLETEFFKEVKEFQEFYLRLVINSEHSFLRRSLGDLPKDFPNLKNLFNEVFYFKRTDLMPDLIKRLKTTHISESELRRMPFQAQEGYTKIISQIYKDMPNSSKQFELGHSRYTPLSIVPKAVAISSPNNKTKVVTTAPQIQFHSSIPVIKSVFYLFNRIFLFGENELREEFNNQIKRGKRLTDSEFFKLDKSYKNLYLQEVLKLTTTPTNPYKTNFLTKDSVMKRMDDESITAVFNEAFYFNNKQYKIRLMSMLKKGAKLDETEMPEKAVEFYHNLLRDINQQPQDMQVGKRKIKEISDTTRRELVASLELAKNLKKGKKGKINIKSIKTLLDLLNQNFKAMLKSQDHCEKLTNGIWFCPLIESQVYSGLLAIIKNLFEHKGEWLPQYIYIICQHFHLLGLGDLNSYDARILAELKKDENGEEKLNIWHQLLNSYIPYEKSSVNPRSCHIETFVKFKIQEAKQWSKRVFSQYEKGNHLTDAKMIDYDFVNQHFPVCVLKSVPNKGLEFDTHEARFNSSGILESFQRCEEAKAQIKLKAILQEHYHSLKEGKYLSFTEGEKIVNELREQIHKEIIPPFVLIFESDVFQVKHILGVDKSDSDSESSNEEQESINKKKEYSKKGRAKKKKKVELEQASLGLLKPSTHSESSFHVKVKDGESFGALNFWQSINEKTVDRVIKTCSRQSNSSSGSDDQLIFPHVGRIVKAVEQVKRQWDTIQMPLDTLKEYQIKNVKTILILSKEEQQGFLLCDEVGLGKTIQIGAAILASLEEPGFVVVVATASTLKQTKAALREYLFAGTLNQFDRELEKEPSDNLNTLYNEFIHYKEFIETHIKDLREIIKSKEMSISRNNSRKEISEKKRDSCNSKLKILEQDWKKKLEEFSKKITSKIQKRTISQLVPPPNPSLKYFNPFNMVLEASSKKKFDKLLPSIKEGSKGLVLFTPDILTKKNVSEPLIEALKKSSVSLFVMDEAHSIKHREKKIYKTIQKILTSLSKRPSLLLATATPFSKDFISIFTLFETILNLTPEERKKWIHIEKFLLEQLEKSQKELNSLLINGLSEEKIDEVLNLLLNTFANFEAFRRIFHLQCGRHTQDQVRVQWDGKIPTKKIECVKVPLEGRQLEASNKFHRQFSKTGNLNNLEEDRNFLPFYQTMELVLFHPDLIENENFGREHEASESLNEFQKNLLVRLNQFTNEELDQWISQSSVLKHFFNRMDKKEISPSMPSSTPALVFVSRLIAGEVLKICISKKYKLPDVPFLQGSTKLPERQRIVENFNHYRTPIVLVSISAGGAGLNFNKTKELFLMGELIDQFTPAITDQAIGRGCRAGEEGEVEIIKYYCKTDIERRVKEIKNSKSRLEKMILDMPLSEEENVVENCLNFIKAIFPPLPYLEKQTERKRSKERKETILNYIKTQLSNQKEIIWSKVQQLNPILNVEIQPMEIEERFDSPMKVENMDIVTQPSLNYKIRSLEKNIAEIVESKNICKISIGEKIYYTFPYFLDDTRSRDTKDYGKEPYEKAVNLGLNLTFLSMDKEVKQKFQSSYQVSSCEEYPFEILNLDDYHQKIQGIPSIWKSKGIESLTHYCTTHQIVVALYEFSRTTKSLNLTYCYTTEQQPQEEQKPKMTFALIRVRQDKKFLYQVCVEAEKFDQFETSTHKIDLMSC